MPVADWLHRDYESYVRDTLSLERLRAHGLFDGARVQGLVDGFYRGGGGYREANKVLSLLVFQEWYELYMRHAAAASPTAAASDVRCGP